MENLKDILVDNYLVVRKDGEIGLIICNRILFNDCKIYLFGYNDRLEHQDEDIYDICKVFKIRCEHEYVLTEIFDRKFDEKSVGIFWERPKEKVFSENEIAIAKVLDNKFKYIARDKGGYLFAYTKKPHKNDVAWRCDINTLSGMDCFEDLFQQIQFTDEEPTLIADIVDSKNK